MLIARRTRWNTESMASMRLLVTSAKQVVTITSSEKTVLIKDEMKHIEVIENGGTSIAVDSSGNIAAIGPDDVIKERYKDTVFETVLDASNMCIIPGFVDPHTHPIWAGDRVHEFAMKLAGATYLEIHQTGGGILYTVDHTNQATDKDLHDMLNSRLEKMLRAGTTTVECKSGYGLDTDSEMRLLKIIESVKIHHPIEISSTFCGAHAIPRGKTNIDAVKNVVYQQIPELKRLMDNKELSVENIDVFCDTGVFDVDQSRTILLAGRNIGLRINFHGDELSPMHGAELGAELHANAVSHLEEISDAGIAAMAATQCVGIMLPTAAYVMHLKPPPVRRMIEAGVPIALGTDFNPNAYCLAMPVVMNLACVTLGMSMSEALVASTLNAAAALGRGKTHGSIQVGKKADFSVLHAPRWEHIIYQFGAHNYVIHTVVKEGRIVYQKDE